LACFWQETKAVEVDTVWMRQTWDITSISFHPSSQFFAVGNSGGYVGIWDVKTGIEIQKYQGNTNSIVKFSKTGKYLLVTNEFIDFNTGNNLICYDFQNDSIVFELKTNYNPYLKTTISSDEQKVVAGGSNTIEIWDIITKKRIFRYDTTGFGGIMDLDISTDGKIIAFSDAGSQRKLRLLNVELNKILFECPIGQYGKLKFSNDGTKLAFTSADSDEAIKIMDVNSKQIIASIPGYPQGVNDIIFSSDDKYLIYSYGQIIVWDLVNKEILKNYPGSFHYLSASNDNKYIAGNIGNYLCLLNFQKEISVRENNLLKATLLFPNPSTVFVTLKSDKLISKILLINEAGATIKELDVSQIKISDGQFTFSIDDLYQGFYLCKVFGAGFTETYKIAVVK